MIKEEEHIAALKLISMHKIIGNIPAATVSETALFTSHQ